MATSSVDKLLKSPLLYAFAFSNKSHGHKTHSGSLPALAKGNIWDLGEPKILIRQCQTLKTDDVTLTLFTNSFPVTCACAHTHTNTHPQTKQYFHISQKISIMHRLSIYIAGREFCGMLHFEVCFIKVFPAIKCNDFIMNLNIKHLHLRTLVKREIKSWNKTFHTADKI